jgi:O-antigen ligase
MTLQDFKPSIRVFLLLLLAISVSLPIAVLSLAKILIFIAALFYIAIQFFRPRTDSLDIRLLSNLTIILLMTMWALSLVWTGASLEEALIAFVKHGKLMSIPILVYLVRSRQEAVIGISALLSGQVFVLLCSWLMAMGIFIPWIDRPSGPTNPMTQYIPYADSYLDQSIMLAASMSILWHLTRSKLSRSKTSQWRWPQWIVLIGLANILILMPGRTGYILAIFSITVAVLFEFPQRLKLWALFITPVLLGGVLFFTVPQFQGRIEKAITELKNHDQNPDLQTSIGARINMWQLSIKAIMEEPLTGHGIGNWTPVIKRIYGPDAATLFGPSNGSNPHQELLLWTVELGVIGALLFLLLLFSLVVDTKNFEAPVQRAVRSLIAMLTIACLFNSSLYDDLMGDYFCIALGFLLALGLRENSRRSLSAAI